MKAIHRLLAPVFLLLGATAADAQVHLSGRVIEDASEQPIAGATVILQDSRGRALARRITDEAGHFSFEVRGDGPVLLQAERIGYQRTTTPPLHFAGYTTYLLEVRLDVAAVPLAPLQIVARSRPTTGPTLAGFEHRRRSGTGWFMSREDIERRNSNRVTDLLRTAPGVSLQRRTVFMARTANCPAQIFIDGSHINRPVHARGRSTTEMFPLDEMVHPSSVEGIEVYQGLGRIPAEFLTPEAACGVVAIWTRRGGER